MPEEAPPLDAPTPAVVDLVVPVYNEGANIAAALAEIYERVPLPKRVLIVYDFDEDDTIPVVRDLMPRYPGLEAVRGAAVACDMLRQMCEQSQAVVESRGQRMRWREPVPQCSHTSPIRRISCA